jgi:hypothetical protein
MEFVSHADAQTRTLLLVLLLLLLFVLLLLLLLRMLVALVRLIYRGRTMACSTSHHQPKPSESVC